MRRSPSNSLLGSGALRGRIREADGHSLDSFGDLPREYALPGHGSRFLIESFLNEIGIERGAQMLILSFFSHSRSPSCVSRQGPIPDRVSAAPSTRAWLHDA